MKVSCILRGGTGNCMFTAAATISYSLKHNIDYCLPSEVQNPHSDNQKVFYSPHLKFCNGEHNGIRCFYNEKSFEYNEIPKQTCEYYIINGYFQSWRYVEPYKEEIIKLFDIPYDFKKDTIFLHYRLGDYRTLSKFHKMIDDVYIAKALDYFYTIGYNKFLVFSDDVEMAKILLRNYKLDFEYSENKTDVEDLSLMSSCAGGIMSASSFSWWGAYLGRNKYRIIVYPDIWFGDSLSHHNTKDLCPPNWTAL